MTRSARLDLPAVQRAKRLTAEQIAYLGGQYDAICWVLTSPRINGDLRGRIQDKALGIKDQLEAAGEKFTPAPEPASRKKRGPR